MASCRDDLEEAFGRPGVKPDIGGAVRAGAWVGECQVEDPPGLEHPCHLAQPADGVVQVFQHLIGDDEVLGRVGDRRQLLGLADEVDGNERSVRQPRQSAAQIVDRQPVHVGDLHAVGQRQGIVEGSDLDAAAAQPPARAEALLGDLHGRLILASAQPCASGPNPPGHWNQPATSTMG